MNSSDDRSLLLELFRATNGPSWKKIDGWDTSASVSTWNGVTVDGDGRVVKVEIRRNILQGEAHRASTILSPKDYVWNINGDGLALAIDNCFPQITK